MGVCTQCQHFRRVRPASQLLAATYSTTHAEVSQALNKIVDDENKQRDEESQYKRAQAMAGKGAWAYRPVMSDFCALNEKNEDYYIAEVRNAGLKCEDFTAGKPARHACSDCSHRIASSGAEKDQTREELFSGMIVKATVAQSSTSQPESLLKTHREGAAARKAFELAGIYSAKGVLPSPPSYADYCGLLSGPDEFVICVLTNSHNTCDKWQLSNEANALATATPAIAARPNSPPSAEPAPNKESSEILVPGPTPLTRTFVSQFIAAMAWILDVKVTPEAAGLIKASLSEDWKMADATVISQSQQFVSLFEQVSTLNMESRDQVREENQSELVASLRTQADPASRALIELYDRANAPIAMGNPMLTREIANCYFDLIALLQSLQRGVEWQPLPDSVKASYAQLLAAQYPMLNPVAQAWFSRLPQGWTSLRASWKNVLPEGREQMRLEILGSPLASTASALPMAGQIQEAVGVTPATHRQSGMFGDEHLNNILANDKAEEERLEKESPELAQQLRLQNSARNAQMMSNMMNMRHQTMMGIIQNFKV